MNGDVDLKRADITENGVPFITSGLENCGVAGLTDRKARIIPSNTITIDMFGNAFYRDFAYKMVTHARVFALLPKFKEMNEHIGLYLTGALSFLPNVFNYSNMCSYAKISDLTIKLPATPEGSPDWDYMDAYISELEQERISELEQERISELDAYLEATGLDDYELTEEDREILASAVGGGAVLPSQMSGNCSPKWAREFKEFELNKLFCKVQTQKIIGKANDFLTAPTKECSIPLLTAGIGNQGLNRYAPKDKCPTILKNVISISANGANTGATFYQSEEFSVLQDAYTIKLIRQEIPNEKVGLYLASAISKVLLGNFSWTFKAGWERIKNLSISLPITLDGNPDFEYMERYIRAMEKVVIADVVAYKNKVTEKTKEVVGV